MFEWIASPEAWLALVTLTALEIVLGIDNIIFLSILVGRLPEAQRERARVQGLALAMITRIGLLLSLAWMMRLTTPFVRILGQEISGRDLILLLGGLFLLWKSAQEIWDSLEGTEEETAIRPAHGYLMVLGQIAIIDIVFSLDSVITAVGMARDLPVMVIAIMIAVGVMMLAAKSIGDFVDCSPEHQDAGPELPDPGGRRPDRRVFRHAHPQGLHLLRHGLLGGGGDAQHPRAQGTHRPGTTTWPAGCRRSGQALSAGPHRASRAAP